MTRLTTLPDAPAPGRRSVGRAVVGGLAALSVVPALTGTAEAAADKRKPKPKRKWHRCKVHTKHTCWRARTCRHRKHKPAQQPDPPTDPGPPTPAGAYDEPAGANGLPTLLALHLASRFTYGMTPALLQEMSGYQTVRAWLDAHPCSKSRINQAEGQKQAQILEAEGDAQARIRRAEGEAQAIRMAEPIKGSKADPANYLIAMKYLETLKEMTSGQNNKVVYIPY